MRIFNRTRCTKLGETLCNLYAREKSNSPNSQRLIYTIDKTTPPPAQEVILIATWQSLMFSRTS